MQKPVPSKNSRSFLEKFEGKKNAISREGLLHLLDLKKQSSDELPRPKEKKVILLREPLPLPTSNTKDNRAEKPKSSPKDPSASNPVLSLNELQERYLRMREQLKGPRNMEMGGSSKVRLPAINKSPSHSTHLHQKSSETAPLLEQNGGQYGRIQSQPRNKEDNTALSGLNKKMELDKYALRHLEFLDKFEKQILQADPISKKTSRSQYN